ncbi:MAG: hypothetical protein QME42_04820 [bacterium]|nr:hypothetical protein [bacterium]
MRKISIFSIITCLILGCAPPKGKDLTTIPEPKYKWKEVEIKWVYSLAIDPTDSNKIYAATEYGVYKSNDKANTWKAVNHRLYNLNVYTVVVDPKRQEIIYVGGDGGVYKSTNERNEWVEKNVGLINPLVRVLAIDPTNSARLYAGCFGSGGLFISDNGGETWEGVGGELATLQITSIAISFNQPHKIYIGTWEKGIYKSEDRGMSFYPVNTGLSNLNIRDVAVSMVGSETIYAAVEGGVLKSENEGKNWELKTEGLLNPHIRTLLIDPGQSEIIYAGTWIGGVYKSEDKGEQWQRINVGLVNTSVHTLIFDPQDSNIIYAGTEGGIFQTIDGGIFWKAKNKGLTRLVKELIPPPIPKEKRKKPPAPKPAHGAPEGGGH